MGLTSRVTTTDTNDGVEAQGDVQDTIGPGGPDSYWANVMMVIDAAHVTLGTVDPPTPYIQTSPDNIRLWWRVEFDPGVTKPFKVNLACKPDASGPTTIAITACTEPGAPPGKEGFTASIGTIYHSGHCCYGGNQAYVIDLDDGPKLMDASEIRRLISGSSLSDLGTRRGNKKKATRKKATRKKAARKKTGKRRKGSR